VTQRWGFRVATDPRFGAGHLERCKALAAALGGSSELFADPGEGDIAWVGDVDREAAPDRASKALAALACGRIAGLVVDSYMVEESEIAEASSRGFTAVFRDGEPYGRENLTIDPNPGAVSGARVLGGPSYVPLDRAYTARHAEARARSTPDDSTVLISFGAYDSANRTRDVLQGLMRLAQGPSVTVALPRSAPHAAEVVAMIDGLPWAEYVGAPADIAALYVRHRLGIGAPGVSQFERACCGLPTILVCQNSRQEPLAALWEKTGAAVRCAPEPAAISQAFAALYGNDDALAAMRRRALSLVDGNGAARIAARLNEELRAN
jgi:spore coat polysaccharide biosynthesis predicted glycosyltransferase SpsG